MRTIGIGLLLLLAVVIPAAAAQDAAICERTVQAAMASAAENCADVGANQVCYGSADVEAIPRYLTAEFQFGEPGALLDVERVETIITEPLNEASETFGVAVVNLQPDDADGARLVLLGNTFTVNNVLPTLQLEMTAATVASVREAPSDFSPVLLSLVPGDTVTATGRAGDTVEIGDDTWIRLQTDDGIGWIPATTLEEDFLVPSLTVVDPADPIFAPMQAFGFTSGALDRACAGVPDSGLLLQTAAAVDLRINGLDIAFSPNSAVFIQAQPDAAMNIFVLEGGALVGQTGISGGNVMRVPVGSDARVTGSPEAPVPYANDKVAPLLLAENVLSGELRIVRGIDEPLAVAEAEGEIVPEATPEVAVVEATPIPGGIAGATEEVAALPTDAPPAVAQEVTPIPGGLVTEEAAPVPPAELDAESAFAADIRGRGVIRVGVNGSLPTFSLEQDGEFTGFEPDLAREIVARLFGEEVEIEWVQVSARQRPNVLVDGNADLLIRNTGFTDESADWGEWTDAFYFLDGQRFMVRADSDIEFTENLVGRTVAVQAGTPTESALNTFAESVDITVQAQGGTFIELLDALESGAVDAISADWTALEAVRQAADDPGAFRIVGDPITDIPWNAAVPPGESAFAAEVSTAIQDIIADGTWASVYNTHFSEPLPPALEVIFAPLGTTTADADTAADVEAVEAAPAEEVAELPTEAPPVEAEEIEPEDEEEMTPPPVVMDTPVPENAPPITGEINITIFTTPQQERTLRIIPNPDGTFDVELVRLGRIVYEATYAYYESSGRYENVRSSFEYIEFSDTAGDTSLGCGREPDIRGFFNGAAFEGKEGC